MGKINLILNTDSYKSSHFQQYPKDTKFINSYIESRGGKFDSSLFFGLQAFIKEYLTDPITQKDISEAEEFFIHHGLPFNKDGWQYIYEKHHGYLPIVIEAVKEGSLIPNSNVLLQIINTDEKCFWLTNYIETMLLRAIWYPTTVATYSFKCKEIILKYLRETSYAEDEISFKAHDFGARGVSSLETSSLGAMAHLVNFQSTDTISGILAAKKYYGEQMVGKSIPAAEHSTIISWGKSHEKDAYSNLLDVYTNSPVSIVLDSYDIWNAIDNIIGSELADKIRSHKSTVVIRPDSGDPKEIVPKTISKLMDIFGFSINKKGFKVLPNYLRVIHGDGISIESIDEILSILKSSGISAENIAFGMGSSLLQKHNRDTLSFVMKSSAVCIKNKWHNICKSPITEPFKKSKTGILALIKEGGQYKTIPKTELNGRENLLKQVYSNGTLETNFTFSEIRKLSETYLK